MKVGNDIVEVKRFIALMSNKKFMGRVYTEAEEKHISSAKDKQKMAERMAGKFSAKEAVAKALGLGISEGVTLNSIEILPDDKGAPQVVLTGEAKKLLEKLGLKNIEVSISNTSEIAFSTAIIF